MVEISKQVSDTSRKILNKFLAETRAWAVEKARYRYGTFAVRSRISHEAVPALHRRKITAQKALEQRILDLEQEVLRLRSANTNPPKEEHDPR